MMPHGIEVGDFVLDGQLQPPSKRATAPSQFSAHVSWGQTAGWIKMPLGTKVGLCRGNIVLDGDPAPLMERGRAVPHFSAHVYCGQTVAHLSNC